MIEQKAHFIKIRESSVYSPKYTIVIPTYKRPATLINAVDSALNQTFENYDILVVDNCPDRDDETENLISRIDSNKINYYKNESNVGMVNNWNQGVIGAKGEWCVMLHDDDLLTSQCLSAIDSTLKSKKTVEAVIPNFKQQKEASTTTQPLNHAKSAIKSIAMLLIPESYPLSANLFCNNIFGPPTCGMAVKKNVWCKFGGWDNQFIAADWEAMIRFSKNHEVVRCNQQSGTYIWAVNTSLKSETMDTIYKETQLFLQQIIDEDRKSKKFASFFSEDLKIKLSGKEDKKNHTLLYKLLIKYYRIKTRIYK